MKIKKIIILAFFIALSFIGANIKIAGSIAFDSTAGFLGTLIMGPFYGAVIGAFGHLLSAAISGFPLSLPVHMIIMVDMALTMFLFGITYKFFIKSNRLLAIIISSAAGVLINGPVSVFMLVPIIGKAVLAMLPLLVLAAALNILVAYLVYKFLPGSVKQWK
ncbi:MAG TPA: ECF transporter S component [Clostridium sp.]|uniref:ECF transporter S component n=1 Tax=Clostridium lapidicellarium TaxID=3240931 RepID=A0ABV4DV60_9CLOT|nr:ECF transporter S component [uncultured Clostridium sp.]NLU07136.1 ECF transporter S component [Clostridiales bacterium]HBC95941.1 ECF transporter S component [Clostridium sp.]